MTVALGGAPTELRRRRVFAAILPDARLPPSDVIDDEVPGGGDLPPLLLSARSPYATEKQETDKNYSAIRYCGLRCSPLLNNVYYKQIETTDLYSLKRATTE